MTLTHSYTKYSTSSSTETLFHKASPKRLGELQYCMEEPYAEVGMEKYSALESLSLTDCVFDRNIWRNADLIPGLVQPCKHTLSEERWSSTSLGPSWFWGFLGKAGAPWHTWWSGRTGRHCCGLDFTTRHWKADMQDQSGSFSMKYFIAFQWASLRNSSDRFPTGWVFFL